MSQKNHVNRLFILGDSLCDQGTLVKATNDILKHTNSASKKKWEIEKIIELKILPPYDRLSLCNGLIFTHKLNYLLQLNILPGWNFHIDNIHSNQTGSNYACIGARIEKAPFKKGLGALIFNNFTLQDQMNALFTHHQILIDDVILINIGTNDLIFYHENNADQFINRIIDILYHALLKIINQNARRIIINNIIDLSIIPRFINRENATLMKWLTLQFNEKLQQIVHKINLEYGFVIYLFDMFTYIQNISQKFLAENNSHRLLTNNQIDLKSMMTEGTIQMQTFVDKNLGHHFYIDDVHFNHWVHLNLAEEYCKIINDLLK